MAYKGYQGYGSKEAVDRQRAIAEALMGNFLQRTPQNIGEGLTAVGQALAIRGRTKKADKLEQEGMKAAAERRKGMAMEPIMAALMGGQAPNTVQPHQPPVPPLPSQQPPNPMSPTGQNLPLPGAQGPTPEAAAQGGIAQGLVETAQALQMDPVDLATIVSYETGGTFDPVQPGPTTKWGQHKGLIQFGEPQAQQYGVDWNDPAGSQLGADGAIARYFRENGWQPGMGIEDAYSIVNAGAPGRYNASDTAAGGAPGTVRDKVGTFGPHREKAMALLGGGMSSAADAGPVQMAQAGTMNDAIDPQMVMQARQQLIQLASDEWQPPDVRAEAEANLGLLDSYIQNQMPMSRADRMKFEEDRRQFEATHGLDRQEFGLQRQGQQFDQGLAVQEFEAGREDEAFDRELAKTQQAWEQFKFENPQLPNEAQMALFAQQNPGAMAALAEFEQSKRPQTNINTGTIPPGYEQFTTPEGAVQMRPIPGGPADAEREEANATADRALQNAMTASDTVTTAAQRARDTVSKLDFGQTGTSVVGQLPWTDSAELLRQVSVLKNSAAAENLNAMRAASKTGGALGNVTEKELKLLMDKSGALDPESPNFLRDLDDYERTLLRTIHGKEMGDRIFEATRNGGGGDGGGGGNKRLRYNPETGELE